MCLRALADSFAFSNEMEVCRVPKKDSEIAVPLQPIISGSDQLDFFSSEFNSLDDLDDNTGNCRTFQSLAGIVTSDMRHQEQRQKLVAPPSVSAAQTA